MLELLRTLRKRVGNEKGFTLVEILIVLVVIGILAAMAIPSLATVTRNAKIQTCKANLRTIAAVAEVYFLDHDNTYPESMDDLVGGGYLKKAVTCPLNGGEYELSVEDDEFVVTCPNGHTLD